MYHGLFTNRLYSLKTHPIKSVRRHTRIKQVKYASNYLIWYGFHRNHTNPLNAHRQQVHAGYRYIAFHLRPQIKVSWIYYTSIRELESQRCTNSIVNQCKKWEEYQIKQRNKWCTCGKLNIVSQNMYVSLFWCVDLNVTQVLPIIFSSDFYSANKFSFQVICTAIFHRRRLFI